MTSSSGKPSLRERKKAKTRASLRDHAMRLFQERGYAATTVEQIAEAAEVSPSTFFRYFPTKEDVVLADDLDPIAFASFQSQPADLSPIEAVRAAVKDVFGSLSEEDWKLEKQRQRLMSSVPELRAAMLLQLVDMVNLLAEQVAQRVGKDAADFEVRSFAGAVTGMSLAVLTEVVKDPEVDYIALMDRALAHLEAGLPL